MEMLVLLLRSRAVATFSKYRAFQRGIEARLAAELGQGRSTEKATATNLSSIDHLIANSSGGSRKLFTNLSHLFFCFNLFLLKRILNNFPDNFFVWGNSRLLHCSSSSLSSKGVVKPSKRWILGIVRIFIQGESKSAKGKKLPQSSDNFYTSNMRRRYEFSSLFCLFGEEQDSLDFATCMVICEMVLPSTSVEILTVYSVFSSKPSNRQLYLYMEANANPNSSCVISVKIYDFLVFYM